MKLEINPRVGVDPVRLGMSREEVKGAIGEAFYSGSHNNSDYYFENSLQVEFCDDMAWFIGMSYSDEYVTLYQGINVFDIEASQLFERMTKNESQPHRYDSSEYCFPDQILTLWDADGELMRTNWTVIVTNAV